MEVERQMEAVYRLPGYRKPWFRGCSEAETAGKPLFLQNWTGSGSEASGVAEGSVRWASAWEMTGRFQIC